MIVFSLSLKFVRLLIFIKKYFNVNDKALCTKSSACVFKVQNLSTRLSQIIYCDSTN